MRSKIRIINMPGIPGCEAGFEPQRGIAALHLLLHIEKSQSDWRLSWLLRSRPDFSARSVTVIVLALLDFPQQVTLDFLEFILV